MQPQPLKLTIKLKIDKSADNPGNVEQEPDAASNSNLPNNLSTNSKDEPKLSCTEALEKHSTEDNEPNENSQYQLVVYDATASGTTNGSIVTRASRRPSNQPARVFPSVGAFTVQCSNCFKWRIVPTKEKYEEIREHITEQPFFCETGREWRPEISCDDPPDITQDGSRLWAIDKPNIAQPPPGWQRLLRLRGEGSSKFADVYYVSPSGKRLRSMVEVQRYLNEHPEYLEDGVSLSRFSFQTPKPLRESYARKRPAQDTFNDDAGSEGISQVQPIAWISPDVDTDLQLRGPGLSTDYSKSLDSTPEIKSAKKKTLKRSLSKGSCNANLEKKFNCSDVDVGESHQL
ncbi:Methyl-CpG-binding domain-containing protein 2 [Striga hermonthica]|uniref:Methyl-CpG-binding domain-containing protein 2 n=1 Tax=Striga hermonthica TaxID=68872 RepID=A0A9N7P071_STRHE|nr:Methyl-CpG-binding domain-containing protein 2 [Striga hermonthica]